MVVSKMGHDAWEKVRTAANFSDSFFVSGLEYPDSLTLALIETVANLKESSPEQVMEDFGRFLVPNTLKECYPRCFQHAGNTPREFLLSMDKIHKQVTDAIANAQPPRFTYEECPNGNLRMHYHSERNLCPLLQGLIHGVGDYFNARVSVQQIACIKDGADHCIMEVSF